MYQGIYEQLINQELHDKINNLENMLIQKQPLDEEEAFLVLSTYVEEVVRKALRFIREDKRKERKDKRNLIYQIELCNHVIALLSDQLEEATFKRYQIFETSEILLAIYSNLNSVYSLDGNKTIPVRPITSIATSSLFTGSTKEPELVSELKKEIASSDRIDMLVSFVKWSGLRLIYDEFVNFVQKPNCKIRIITTCYMGATDFGAIDKLAQLDNVEIKISYDTAHTRLHAKSYLFQRDTGFTTAYIGSSNMSNAAMTSGLEWNLKVTEKDSFEVVRKFHATFESYWASYDFETYHAHNESDQKKLKDALLREKQGTYGKNQIDMLPIFDIRPYAYQQEILDNLKAEREIFHKYKNLVIAATGVGKTIIAAFDFKDFYKKNPGARLLFVAHREEILTQSILKFRAILKEPNFGELLTGNHTPSNLDHLFVTIQSLNSNRLISKITKDFYSFIIVDEFHHSAATSYQQLLDYFEPQILLGLTATPERMDGKNILERFDDRIASEMRLPEAIDHKLLVPFHYFCVTDDIDLSTLKWTSLGYQPSDLSHIFLMYHKNRVKTILNSMERYLADIKQVKGLGFCVSVEHANAMADAFNQNNIPSISVTGQTDRKIRESAKSELVSGDIKMIFTVDVYNEGIDIPEINTVLFLRPTASLTVFLQQLGRGLRHSDDKECLTVLDYVGRAHEKYNYEERFRALLHKSKHSIREGLENEVLSLPRGCHIKMEKLAKEYILQNIKNALINKATIVSRIRTFSIETNQELDLYNFLKYYHMDIIDFYGKQGNRSLYTMMCLAVGKTQEKGYGMELVKRYKNLFFIDSKRILTQAIDFFEGKTDKIKEKKIEAMIYYSFYLKEPEKENFSGFDDALERLRLNPIHCKEIIDIFKYQYERIQFVDAHQDMNIDTPLDVHCTYTTNQILAGIGYYNENQMPEFREGVLHLKSDKTDVFFITLNKSDKEFSEATMYEDYPINEFLFHWQSQNKTSNTSNTALRYINHENSNHDILLFVRDTKKHQGFTSPFIFLGKAHYVKHQGSSPVSFVWRLEKEMPARFLEDQLSLAK